MTHNERSLALHKKHRGKTQTLVPFPLETEEDLAAAYTPGVAAPCREIAEDPESVYTYTSKGHTVAVVTDGTSVLGLGDIGPEASLPVMEGKAALFKTLANVDAVAIPLATKEVDEVVDTIVRIAPAFGGINLEDIAAPNCFLIERALQERLNIPVMHDDQHGTAIVATAGLLNALRVVEKTAEGVRVVISGAGAAGIATAHMLHALGVRDIVVCDSKGALSSTRTDLNPFKQEVLAYNVTDRAGSLQDVLVGADVFIGVSRGNLLTASDIATMNADAIVFALANPDPEILPAEALKGGAAVVATGRSDFPNQLNNVLAFPGIFKGALDARASTITMPMKLAAAQGIAAAVEHPTATAIVPSALNRRVPDIVAAAVAGHIS